MSLALLPTAANSLTRFATTLLLALVALLPTGCIGFQAIIGQKEVEAGRQPHVVWGNHSIRRRADALRVWGEPRRRKVLPGGREVWKYRQPDMRWRGVLVWAVIVPAPLLVPTGRRKVWLEFSGDTLTRVTNQDMEDKCYGLFLFRPMASESISELWRH